MGVSGQLFGDGGDYGPIGQHAELDGVGSHVIEAGAYLVEHQIGTEGFYIVHRFGILNRHRSHRGHGVAAHGCDGFQIGLQTGPGGGVGTGDYEYFFSQTGFMGDFCQARVSHACQ